LGSLPHLLPLCAPPPALQGRSAASPAGGLSAEQREFLERKRRESSVSAAPAPTRGRSAPRAPPARRATSSPPAARPASTPAPSAYSAPAPSGGLSAEQRDFLERKARETSRSPAPAPTRGRSAVSARPARPSARPASRTPAPASYSAPSNDPASYNPPSSNSGAAGLSAEQREFLERKARETSRSPAPAPTRGRSAVSSRPARPSARPVSNSAGASSLNSSYASPAPSGGLSAEQRAFLERKSSVSRSPAPAARGRSSAPSSNGSAAGLSAEQLAFLERKRQGMR
jgi:hypothetical protein